MFRHILLKIQQDDLSTLIEHEQLQQIYDLLDYNYHSKKLDKKEILVNVIEASYGTEIMNEKRIRQFVYYTLDESILKDLTSKYCKRSYEKPYDNAIALSMLPWKLGNEFVSEVAELLNLSNEYLPQISIQNPTTEEIAPLQSLHPLHSYQEDLKEKIKSSLSDRKKRFLVQMPTGSGKTRTVLEAVIEYAIQTELFKKDSCIVWLAHTEELCEQAIETLTKLWLNLSTFPIGITRLWGNHLPQTEYLKACFVVGTLQKFVSLHTSDSYIYDFIKSKTEILIIDEAHKSIAKTYAAMLEDISDSSSSSMIGITATPGRAATNESENRLLANFFSKILLTPSFDGNPIIQLQKKGILARLNRMSIQSKLNVELTDKELQYSEVHEDISQTTINKLAKNSERNRIILEIIISENAKGNPSIVFSCNTEHSKLLNAALNLKGIASFYIDATTNKVKRKQIIDKFKGGEFDILINYGILSTGFDAPRLRSIIVTRPTSSVVLYSQIIGRGLRGPKMGGAEVCNLYDIKDNFLNFGGVDNVYNYFDGYW
jgi:DNA repair protein RadD